MDTKAEITIIGAGVVGLAVAATLAQAGYNPVLLERHISFGQEISSRSSEVIHAGIYYEPGSLKARLCLEGNQMLYNLCRTHDIPYKPLGKLIVAINAQEMQDLEALLDNARKSGAQGIHWLTPKQIQELEPNISALGALFAPSSGIIDSHRLMQYFETQALNHGAILAYGNEVAGIEKNADDFNLEVLTKTSERYRFKTKILINCAGLDADKLAALAGIDIMANRYRIYYNKGEYFRINESKRTFFPQRLIYPAPPAPGHVGIHTVTDVGGAMKLGPHSYYVEKINYNVDETYHNFFYTKVKAFLPYLEFEDLTPDTSGIQPKLHKPGEPARDFIICHEADQGLPGLISLVGIDSPGLTSSPAIARYVKSMVQEIIKEL
jgi:L-2-hydroxyglutarate oxidase LhgO